MVSKTEELEERVNKFEDKIKLANLLTEKRFAELGLKIGKLDEKLKGILTDFPELKERSSKIEDILNIINLGLTDYKKKFEEINSRISKLEKIPENIELKMANHEKEIKNLREDINKLSANVNALNSLKEEITKSMNDAISLTAEGLKKDIEANRMEINHIKNGLDAFASTIKSFERTVELTNLDDIIRRFDSLDRRMMNMQTDVERFRSLFSVASMTEKDVDILKEKLKEISSSVMDALSRMNEFELNVNKKLTSMEEFTKKAKNLDFIESVSKEVKEQAKKMNEMKARVEDLYKRTREMHDIRSVDWSRLEKLAKEISELEKLKNEMEDIKEKINKDKSKLYNFNWG